MPLKDKGRKTDRILSGFVLNDNEITNGSYAIYSYSDKYGDKLREEGVFMNSLLSDFGQ